MRVDDVALAEDEKATVQRERHARRVVDDQVTGDLLGAVVARHDRRHDVFLRGLLGGVQSSQILDQGGDLRHDHVVALAHKRPDGLVDPLPARPVRRHQLG